MILDYYLMHLLVAQEIIIHIFRSQKMSLKKKNNQRIIKLKKRKHDASTALMASLGHKISRHGRKVLVSKGGATASRK